MKLMWKRSLTTTFTDKRTNQKHEIRTVKLEHEPNLFFEQRHKFKIRAKKYWLSKLTKNKK